FGDGPALPELVAHTLGPVRHGVASGRQPRDGLEQTVKVIGTQARMRCQLIQIGYFLRRFYAAANRGNGGGMLLGKRRLVGPAALAWPESGPFGLFPGFMELYILRFWHAGSAGRPAVNAGRADRIIECAVHG